MDYKPTPIDTSEVVLDEEICNSIELLAENTHDIWASQRISEGWSYGPQGDDAKKENPLLVPYKQLTESEKDYDRKLVINALKLIVVLGYEIKKKG